MKPSEFEALLGLRTRLTEDLINGASPLMLTVAAMITLGFVLCCARLVVNVARLRTLVGSAYLWRRFRSVEIRISDQVHIPFSTRGIRRRIIVLPSAMLAEPENQRISLAHEFQHLRNGDLEWELALELLRPLAFWNPVYLIWKRQVERLRELNCDHALVVRARIDPRAYSDCLLEVCRRSLRHDGARQIAMPRIGLISPLAGVRRRRSQKELFERLAALMSHVDDHSARPLRWIMAVPVVLSIAVLCLAIQRPGDWSQDRLMLSTIVNLERLEHLNATPLR